MSQLNNNFAECSGDDVVYRRFMGGQDHSCYVYEHPDHGQLCVKTGRSGFGGPHETAVRGQVLRNNLQGKCHTCGAYCVSVEPRVRVHAVNHNYNFLPLGVGPVQRSGSPDALLADHPDAERVAIYKATSVSELHRVGYTVHMHIVAGHTLSVLQHKCIQFGADRMTIDAIVNGVYMGLEEGLPFVFAASTVHVDYNVGLCLLVKFTSLTGGFMQDNGVSDHSGLVTVDNNHTEHLIIQVRKHVRDYNVSVLLNFHGSREGAPPRMGAHDYVTVRMPELSDSVIVGSMLEVGHYYMWLRF